MVSAACEAFVEGKCFSADVIGVTAEAVDAEYVSVYETAQHTLWVGGCWWDVEVEVLFFFVEGGFDFVVGDGEGEIHKVT